MCWVPIAPGATTPTLISNTHLRDRLDESLREQRISAVRHVLECRRHDVRKEFALVPFFGSDPCDRSRPLPVPHVLFWLSAL